MSRNVCILKYDKSRSIFRVFSPESFNLDIIPRIGEKIVYDENGSAIISEIIDVHYSVEGNVDIFIGNEQPYTEFKSALDASYSGK